MAEQKAESGFFGPQAPIWMAGIVVVSMIILMLMNLTLFIAGPPHGQFLSFSEIRGMAVDSNRVLFTLNYEQQSETATFLNSSKPIQFRTFPGEETPKNVHTIVVYRFNNKPDLEIIPLAYVDNNLVFTVPEWSRDQELVETSGGKLKELLSKTYD